MIVKRVVGPRGQIVIPKVLRDHLGIKEGSEVVLEVREDAVVIRARRSPLELVEDYLSIVGDKMKEEVDLEKVIDEEVLKGLDILRQ